MADIHQNDTKNDRLDCKDFLQRWGDKKRFIVDGGFCRLVSFVAPALLALMETSLHRRLKEIYAGADAQTEVPLGRYRIDAIVDDELIEVQHGSLSAIRDKIGHLVKKHRVLVVKPIIACKRLIKLTAKGGDEKSRRMSPKRGTILDLFDELIYFTRVFPHPNLTLEVPLVEVEEQRYPGHGRRRRWRERDFVVQDQQLVSIRETYRFHTAADLTNLIPGDLPTPFHTGHLAESLSIDRWIAQRIAYCFRKMGTTVQVGKERNALLYKFVRHAKTNAA